MRITRPRDELFRHWRVEEALRALVQAPPPCARPPCPNCSDHRPALCSPACPQAARASSSDPDHYPLEAAVVPLVYELNALHVFQSCWSCEGHLDAQARLWKRPQIGFYTASSACAMLLSRYLEGLFRLGELAYAWKIALTDFGVSRQPTYCIEPNALDDEAVHLGKLQSDLRRMAYDLGPELRRRACDYLQQYYLRQGPAKDCGL